MFSHKHKMARPLIITFLLALPSQKMAFAFEIVQNPDIPSCMAFQNNGQFVILPDGNAVGPDGNCNPAHPEVHYTARAISKSVIRLEGMQICDFILMPDGVHLYRRNCKPNPNISK